MTRVMLLAPTLILLGLYVSRTAPKGEGEAGGVKVVIPWFAVGFIATAGLNSLNILPPQLVAWIIVRRHVPADDGDDCAGHGDELSPSCSDVGVKPFYVALVMFVWLVVGGYLVTNLALRLW